MDYFRYLSTLTVKLELLVDSDKLMLALGLSLPKVAQGKSEYAIVRMVLIGCALAVEIANGHYEHSYHSKESNQSLNHPEICFYSVTVTVKNIFFARGFLFDFLFFELVLKLFFYEFINFGHLFIVGFFPQLLGIFNRICA